MNRAIAVAWTGASGMAYGARLVATLLEEKVDVWLMISHAARIVAQQELGWTLPRQSQAAQRALLPLLLTNGVAHRFGETPSTNVGVINTVHQAQSKSGQEFPTGVLRVFDCDDWNAPLASGSNPPDAYVICPCTMSTLAKVAGGVADDLLTRAADVVLKEGRKLLLVPRETPLSAIHLTNMLTLVRAGAIILPPNPGFYTMPASIADVVDFIVARILNHIGVAHQMHVRWGD